MNQGRRHVNKFRTQVDIHLPGFVDVLQVLLGDGSNGDIPYIDLLFADQVEQEIKRAFVMRDMKTERERRHRLTR